MEPLLIFKALSNETRRQIMLWLKHPEQYFDEKPYLQQGLSFQTGVCVGDIQAKAGLAQSVISSYLLTMQKPSYWSRANRKMDVLPPEREDHSAIFRVRPKGIIKKKREVFLSIYLLIYIFRY